MSVASFSDSEFWQNKWLCYLIRTQFPNCPAFNRGSKGERALALSCME